MCKADQYKNGSVEAFRTNWSQRRETRRYHFKRGVPENQVQFAFQSHWRVFQRILGEIKSGRSLEAGCGRGSMSAYFADDGFDAYLLDTSHVALQSAGDNFLADDLTARSTCGDALTLPFPSGFFDVVVSIGLLEHFVDIRAPLVEQLRILRPGGVFLGYIVPERRVSVQTLAIPINAVLRLGYAIYSYLWAKGKPQTSAAKTSLYRSDYAADDYLSILQRAGVRESGSFGMFPVPLISHSSAFPFSLMPQPLERLLVRLWQGLLKPRPGAARDPWICPERWGLAFLVWARK